MDVESESMKTITNDKSRPVTDNAEDLLTVSDIKTEKKAMHEVLYVSDFPFENRLGDATDNADFTATGECPNTPTEIKVEPETFSVSDAVEEKPNVKDDNIEFVDINQFKNVKEEDRLQDGSVFEGNVRDVRKDSVVTPVITSLKQRKKQLGKKNDNVSNSNSEIGNRPTCSECGQTFAQKCSLLRHLRLHKGERPYGCPTCEKSFPSASYLNRHMIIHSGERPFLCDICGKAFARKSDVATHTKFHKGVKPYCCNVCEKSFTSKSDLVRHMRIHTGERPFSCSSCGKSFNSTSSLRQHTMVHTGERPFVCDICSKAFSGRTNLLHHKQTHTGEKPFKCKECGRSYSTKKYLSVHMESHSSTQGDLHDDLLTQEET